MLQNVDAGASKTDAGNAGGPAGGGANPPAWDAATQARNQQQGRQDAKAGDSKTSEDTKTGAPDPKAGGADGPGHVQFQGSAGAGDDTVVNTPDAKSVAPTATAPYDPSAELNRLKGDGDTATFSVSAGARLAVPTPWKVNVGGQVQAGYGVTVKQVGGGGPGEPATTTPPKYQVTFDKNQMAGGLVSAGAGSAGLKGDLFGKISGEVNLTHADRVTMTFDTKDDAARSIRILQGETEAQSLRDVATTVDPKVTLPDPVKGIEDFGNKFVHDPLHAMGDALNPVNQAHNLIDAAKTAAGGLRHDVGSLFGNPLKGDNGSNAPPPNTIQVPLSPAGALAGAGLNYAADKVQPSRSDLDFLKGHMTGYEEQAGVQERASLELKFGDMGIDPRLAANQTITRTVTLPTAASGANPAKPGTVAYELKGSLDLSANEKAKVGGTLWQSGLLDAAGKVPALKGALGVSSTVPLGNVSVAAKLTYDMTPAQSDALKASNGTQAPGVGQMGAPKSLDLTLAGKLAVPAAANESANFKFQGSIPYPEATLGTAKDKLFQANGEGGGVGGAIDTLARNGTLTGELNLSHQTGGNISIAPGLSLENGPASGAEARLTFTGTAQTDTIDARAVGKLSWHPDPAPETAKPPAAPIPTPQPAAQAAAQPTPYQVAVLPHAGLNIRAEPGEGAKVLGPAYSGTFLQATGQTRTDAHGDNWLEVHGPDMNQVQRTGWVNARYVERHDGGGEDATGRINQLRQQGYVPIKVHHGDTISGIALAHGVDPSKAVATNAGHVIDTNLIFPGDTVYIPKR